MCFMLVFAREMSKRCIVFKNVCVLRDYIYVKIYYIYFDGYVDIKRLWRITYYIGWMRFM